MKNAINFYTIIVFIFAVLIVIGCKAKQPLQSTTIESTDKSTQTNTSEKTTINQAILDEMFIKISEIYSSKPECDSLINYYRAELARSIAISKTSGDNGYEIKFNELKKQLEFLIKVGKTENQNNVRYVHTNNTYFKEKLKEVSVRLPLTWWENLFYRIGQICTGFAGLYIVYFIVKLKKL